jgi:2-methylcitrate dehydratase PrpD
MAAKQGFTGPKDVLTVPRGFFYVHTGKEDLDDIVLSGPEHRFEVTRNSFKPYPSGVITHPAIDAIMSIRDEYQVDPGQIEQIRLEVHPMVLEITGNRNPRTGLEGKFSIQHCVAVACLDRNCGLAQFTDERVQSREVIDLRGRVHALMEASFRETEARVTVLLKDGRILEKHVPHGSGTEHNPLSDEQLQRKYEQNSRRVMDRENTEKLAELIWNVQASGNVAALLELTLS